jgi:hypothetical protein
MLHYNTLGIQFKNKIYILFSSNSSKQNLFKIIKNYEYNINFIFFMFLIKNRISINNKDYINLNFIYLYKIIIESMNILIFNIIFNKNIFIYPKYNFFYFFEKATMYTYLDRFFYVLFVNKIYLLNNKINILGLIEIFSYNYINILVYLYNYKNNNINIKYNYIIFNRFLNKYINNIYMYIYNFVYNIELIKKYI